MSPLPGEGPEDKDRTKGRHVANFRREFEREVDLPAHGPFYRQVEPVKEIKGNGEDFPFLRFPFLGSLVGVCGAIRMFDSLQVGLTDMVEMHDLVGRCDNPPEKDKQPPVLIAHPFRTPSDADSDESREANDIIRDTVIDAAITTELLRHPGELAIGAVEDIGNHVKDRTPHQPVELSECHEHGADHAGNSGEEGDKVRGDRCSGQRQGEEKAERSIDDQIYPFLNDKGLETCAIFFTQGHWRTLMVVFNLASGAKGIASTGQVQNSLTRVAGASSRPPPTFRETLSGWIQASGLLSR